MRILITGASGFIGSRIAYHLLLSNNHQLVCTGRTRPSISTRSSGGARAVDDPGHRESEAEARLRAPAKHGRRRKRVHALVE